MVPRSRGTNWTKDKEVNDDLPKNHRRWLLYYWFAADRLSETRRDELPTCVVTAIRGKYYQLITENDYVGYVSTADDAYD